MSMRIVLIFICLLFLISCKKESHVISSDYVYNPILRIQNKSFFRAFDQVIIAENKCIDNKNIDFSVQFLIDTTSEFSHKNGDTVILIWAHKYSRRYCTSEQINKTLYGSVWYNKHLFNIYSEFKNTGWFKIGDKVQRLILRKSNNEVQNAPPVAQEVDEWIFIIKKQNLVLLEENVKCNQAKEIIQIE